MNKAEESFIKNEEEFRVYLASVPNTPLSEAELEAEELEIEPGEGFELFDLS